MSGLKIRKAKPMRILTIKISFRKIVIALPSFFYLSNLLLMMNINGYLYRILLPMTGIIGIGNYMLSNKFKSKEINIYVFVYIISLIFNMCFTYNIGLAGIIYNVFFIGIFLIMVYNPWSKNNGIFIFYTSVVLISIRLLTSDSKRILTSSSNYISILLLLACSFYYIALEMDNDGVKLLDLFPAGLCFLISVWAGGRGGIISCAFLLTMLLAVYMRNVSKRKTKRFILLFMFFMFLFVLLYIRNISIVESFLNLGKFANKGTTDNARQYIWLSYISKAAESGASFIFGATLNDIPIISRFEGNTHNSFLQLHAYCGIVIFVITIVLAIKSLIFYIRNKQYIFEVMLLTIIIRGMTDKFIFGQYGMPIMLFFILYPFAVRKPNRVNSMCKYPNT